MSSTTNPCIRTINFAGEDHIFNLNHPTVLAIVAGGNDMVRAGSSVVIQGDASEKTVALIRQALTAHDATLPSKVVAAVTDARKRRQLS